MNDYRVQATRSVPEVEMRADNGLVRLEGECFPEDSVAFFEPVFAWLKAYMAETRGRLRAEFRLSYFNSSSSKFLLDMVALFDGYVQQGGRVEARWFYASDDEDLRESGEELAEDAHFPFALIETPVEE
jgi:hypothetical protein